MRGMRTRKLVTLSDHRRREKQGAPPVEPRTPDPSEAETAAYPVLRDQRAEIIEKVFEEFLVPRLKPRTLGVEPLRSDLEERYRA